MFTVATKEARKESTKSASLLAEKPKKKKSIRVPQEKMFEIKSASPVQTKDKKTARK
jgi:hypothetical protein